MNINEMFPGNYLKAADFPVPRVMTIKAVTIETIGDEKTEKPVLHFFEAAQGLILNKTNASMLAHIYGNNTDAWLNRPIELHAEPVSFQGKIVNAIRVRMSQQPVAQVQAAPVAPVMQPQAPAMQPAAVVAQPVAPQPMAAPAVPVAAPVAAPVSAQQGTTFTDLETDIDY